MPMLEEEKQQLIERFFNGELTPEESELFKSLLKEEGFRTEVELQRTLIGGIRQEGNKLMREELKQIHAEVKGQMKDYRPPGSSGFGKFFKWLLGAGIIGATVYFIINNKALFPTESFKEKLEQYDSTLKGTEPSATDTVYHTIRTNRVLKGDTIITYSVKQTRELLEGDADTLVYIKRDTIHKIIRNKNMGQ